MPRGPRTLVDGETYHVLSRGNNGQVVFHHEVDFQRYLHLLAEYAKAHRLTLYHFVLMPNHVHLVLRAQIGEALSQAMKALNLAYSQFYQKRHRYSGHLWQGRFKSLWIDRDAYLLECGRYVELNPVRANLVQDPSAYAWSSYRTYAHGTPHPFITPHPLYEALGTTPIKRQERYRQFVQDGLLRHRPTMSHHFAHRAPQRATRLNLLDPHARFSFADRRGRPKKGTVPFSEKGTVPFLPSSPS